MAIMFLGRIEEIKKMTFSDIAKDAEPIANELQNFLNDDKKFLEFAKWQASKTKKGNVGIVNLFMMIDLAEEYFKKEKRWLEYKESNKPSKEAKVTMKDTIKEPEVDIFDLDL